MKIKKLLSKYGILVILLVLIVIFGAGNSAFLTVGNFINILRQIAIRGYHYDRHELRADRRWN